MLLTNAVMRTLHQSMNLTRSIPYLYSQKGKQRDTTQLSQEQVDQILFRTKIQKEMKKQPEFQTELDDNPTYHQSIDSILQKIRDQNEHVKDNSKQEETNQEKSNDSQENNDEAIPPDQNLTHVKDEAIKPLKYSKYDLPIPNVNPQVELQTQKALQDERLPSTETQNLFELFSLNKDSQYMEYEKKVQIYLNSGIDMYGRQINDPKVDLQLQQALLEQNAIPLKKLDDEKYMAHVLNCFQLNLTMPGTIENEHPHRFMKLRPVDEFRHTPLIPISERQMQEFDARVEAYHRKGFFFEVQRQTLYQLFFFFVIGSIMYKMFMLVLLKEEQYGVAFHRLKYSRMGLGQRAN